MVLYKVPVIIADELMVKECGKCNELKHFTFFSKNKNRKDGLQYYCKSCSSKLTSSTRNVENYKKYQNDNRHFSHLTSIKARAKKNGIPFNLTIEDFLNIPDACPILGIPLERNFGKRVSWENSPSVDRIIPELGYVKGNVIIISTLANRIKQNATPEQIIKVGKFYEELASKP